MATQEEVDKTQHYADMIMELAEEMNMVDEHAYVEDVHMAKMKELADKGYMKRKRMTCFPHLLKWFNGDC